MAELVGHDLDVDSRLEGESCRGVPHAYVARLLDVSLEANTLEALADAEELSG
jgi:hypothetical protein